MPTFAGFPIAFTFRNEEQEATLFIAESAAAPDMTLSVSKVSAAPVAFKNLPNIVSAVNYHFELQFRPGTVNEISSLTLTTTNFTIFVARDTAGKITPNADGTVSLYFKASNNRTWAAEEKIIIKGLRAAAATGNRNTRVMLRYKNLIQETLEFDGQQEQQLAVISRPPNIELPLSTLFTSGNVVVNDGITNNILKIRVTNILQRQKQLEAGTFQLIMETGSTSFPQTLGISNQVRAAVVTAKIGSQNLVVTNLTPAIGANPDAAPDIVKWEIRYTVLAPGAAVDIEISNLKTNHPSGFSNLILFYEGIPGFAAGQFIFPVEKSPLVLNGNSLGIGTANPQGNLHISSGIDGDCKLILEADTDNNNEGDNSQILFRQDGSADFSAISQGNNSLTISNSVDQFGGIVFSTNVIDGYTNAIERMRITSAGLVGIGTTSPSAKLTVVPLVNTTGMEVLSPSFGASHFPHANGGNYISGKSVVFRSFESDLHSERIRFDLTTGNVLFSKSISDPKSVFYAGASAPVTPGTANVLPVTEAKLQLIHEEQDASKGTLILGPTTSSNLRLGYHANYSWIQSHAGKPLVLNPVGHNVGIGTTAPASKLTVVPAANSAGIEVISSSFGTTQFSNSAGENYVSGKGIAFRSFDAVANVHSERMRVDLTTGNVVISKTIPAAGSLLYAGAPISAPLALSGVPAPSVLPVTEAKLHLIHEEQDASKGTLILGPTTSSNLRLGYHANYSWIQSHAGKPLVLNPVGYNVGIGTTAPASKLTVVPAANSAGIEVISSSFGTTQFSNSAGENYVSGKGIAFRSFDAVANVHSERMRFDLTTGNVLFSKSISDPKSVFYAGASAPVTPGTADVLPVTEAKLQLIHEEQDASKGTLILGPTTSSNLRLGYHANYSWIQSHAGKPLVLNPVGHNVGIGTTNPTSKLSVVSGNSETGISVFSATSGDTHFPFVDGKSYISGSGVVFRSYNSTNKAYSDKMVINMQNGNVGIGTTTPESHTKLHIVATSQDANQGALVIGEISGFNSNLRLGSHTNYSWIQSHGAKPLALNPIGNYVGIQSADPKKQLHIGNPNNETYPGIRIDGRKVNSSDLTPTFWEIVVDAAAGQENDQDLRFHLNGNLKGWIEPATGAWTVGSDVRLKRDIAPLNSVLDKVLTLVPSKYRWKEDKTNDRPESIGFIAQEVEQLFPDLVREKDGIKTISYGEFSVLAIAAIKEQQVEIEACKKQLQEHQAFIQQLATRLEALEGK